MIVARGLGKKVSGETSLYGILVTFGLGIDGSVGPVVPPGYPTVPMDPFISVQFDVHVRGATLEVQ